MIVYKESGIFLRFVGRKCLNLLKHYLNIEICFNNGYNIRKNIF
ncbi:hypothetical protein HMPREF3033_01808 [Veillonellaceae bacterium DNF00751]|uniref:Uncharacterized protein n=1 Tax=Megasphaera lornae TaxID=1000568 RepID=A0ABN0D0E4_9FIRM|nr:hypothetical protein HMPREF1039_0313 [Megasphaera lornae]KXB89477.1 hypothetical protein HMPREF3033_01808 [Veillonellaceae bacterium DNF00751]